MNEMLQLRQIHCAMWSEAVREIVSAENSDLKFLVTDSPVTVYNRACEPDSVDCKYPDDPSIALKGSQTIFPLDLDHCLIFTNLEYARNPISCNPMVPRTNARFRGKTITYIGEPTAERTINAKQVEAINYLLKSRATKYIAARKKEWLNPDKCSWDEVGQILLPPERVWCNFGGEISIGFENGSFSHQDEFGRSVGVLPHLVKKSVTEKDGPVLRDVKERNIFLINAVENILGLNKGKTWMDVRKELCDEQVRAIHEIYAFLWPIDTNLNEMLPKADNTLTRVIYTGLVDPRTILKSVIGCLQFFDEILVINPFPNDGCIKPEWSPVQCPELYKSDTLKNAFLLLQLAPFIESGAVNLIPSPCDFDIPYRQEIIEMTTERLKSRSELDSRFMEEMSGIIQDDYLLMLAERPEECVARDLREDNPTISDEEVKTMLLRVKHKRDTDPLVLLQPIKPGEKKRRLLRSGFAQHMEETVLLAHITGSFIYSNSRQKWEEMRNAVNPLAESWNGSVLGNTLEPFQNILLRKEMNLNFRTKEKEGDKHSEIRESVRNVCVALQSWEESEKCIEECSLKLENMKRVCENLEKKRFENLDECANQGIKESCAQLRLEVFPKGLGLTTIHRLLLTYGGTRKMEGNVVFLYLQDIVKC